jgi:hypothetical protein
LRDPFIEQALQTIIMVPVEPTPPPRLSRLLALHLLRSDLCLP